MGQPIIARRRRVECEIEQVLPGADSDDPFSDAMKESIERWNSHDNAEARQTLNEICQSDLRCLDHAHLGNFIS